MSKVKNKLNNFKFIGIFLTIMVIFTSCDTSDNTENLDLKGDNENVEIPFEEEALKTVIMQALQLSADDYGTFETYQMHFNADEFEDGLVVVNLAPKANADMAKAKNPATFHDQGYIGNYNYLFVWDGSKRTLGPAFKIVSNGLSPLKLTFSNLIDVGFKTISAEYRLGNGVFQTFFSNTQGTLAPVFSYNKIDYIGKDSLKVTWHKLEENPELLQKDIVIYEAIWKDYDVNEASKNPNEYPLGEIVLTDKEVYRFFYDPKSRKYATWVED
jgi:hypothetical protein